MKKSLTGTVDTTDTSILTVDPDRVACDVCLVLNNDHSAATTVSLSHRRGAAEALIKKTLLGQQGMDNASTLLPLTGVVFDEGDELVLEFTGATGSINYVVSYLEEKHRGDTLSILELMSRKLLEGMARKQICFMESPAPADPPMIPPPSGNTGRNANTTRLTADVAVTTVDPQWQDVVSVTLTPSSADANIRIWLTLFWDGLVRYRLVQEYTAAGTQTLTTNSITSVLKTSDPQVSAETEPVVFPIAHAPGVTDEQTYKLQAQAVASTGTYAISVGTTLSAEEISS